MVDLSDDLLLGHLLLYKDLSQLAQLVVGMDLAQVAQLVDKLGRVDVQVVRSAFLADQPLRTFGVDAHVLADLLVDVALGVYQVTGHRFQTAVGLADIVYNIERTIKRELN